MSIKFVNEYPPIDSVRAMLRSAIASAPADSVSIKSETHAYEIRWSSIDARSRLLVVVDQINHYMQCAERASSGLTEWSIATYSLVRKRCKWNESDQELLNAAHDGRCHGCGEDGLEILSGGKDRGVPRAIWYCTKCEHMTILSIPGIGG